MSDGHNGWDERSGGGGQSQSQGQWNNRNGGGQSQWNGGNKGGGSSWGSNKGGWQGGKGGGNNWQGNRGNFKRDEPEDTSPAIYKAYVVIGNDNPPEDVIRRIKSVISKLGAVGYTLRTSPTRGLQMQIYTVDAPKKELHVPFRGYAIEPGAEPIDTKFTYTSEKCKAVAASFHGAYDTLKPMIQKILCTNVRLVLGKDLMSPARFAIIWSEDGVERPMDKTPKTLNMQHPIAICSAELIPVFNFANADAEARLFKYLNLPEGNQHGTKEQTHQQEPRSDRGGYDSDRGNRNGDRGNDRNHGRDNRFDRDGSGFDDDDFEF